MLKKKEKKRVASKGPVHTYMCLRLVVKIFNLPLLSGELF